MRARRHRSAFEAHQGRRPAQPGTAGRKRTGFGLSQLVRYVAARNCVLCRPPGGIPANVRLPVLSLRVSAFSICCWTVSFTAGIRLAAVTVHLSVRALQRRVERFALEEIYEGILVHLLTPISKVTFATLDEILSALLDRPERHLVPAGVEHPVAPVAAAPRPALASPHPRRVPGVLHALRAVLRLPQLDRHLHPARECPELLRQRRSRSFRSTRSPPDTSRPRLRSARSGGNVL